MSLEKKVVIILIFIISFRGNRDLSQNGEQIGVQQYGATLQYGLDVQTNEWSKVRFTSNSTVVQSYPAIRS